MIVPPANVTRLAGVGLVNRGGDPEWTVSVTTELVTLTLSKVLVATK